MFQEDLLKGKRILVTGGGSGLGKEMSRYFLKYGAEVLICGRRVSVLEDTAKELMDEGKPWKPKNGIKYWINAPLIRTSSQKYDYMNYIQLIGKGVIADLSAGYVTYNLYRVLYSK